MADVSDSALADAYKEIRVDKNETNWILGGYEGNAKIVLQGKGSGGVSELVSNFKDDQAQYAYVRVITGDSESRRTKFVFVSWCGDKVGALKRAKMSVHKASIKTVWRDYAVELHGESPDDLTEDIIMAKVKKAGGADYSGSLSGGQ